MLVKFSCGDFFGEVQKFYNVVEVLRRLAFGIGSGCYNGCKTLGDVHFLEFEFVVFERIFGNCLCSAFYFVGINANINCEALVPVDYWAASLVPFVDVAFVLAL